MKKILLFIAKMLFFKKLVGAPMMRIITQGSFKIRQKQNRKNCFLKVLEAAKNGQYNVIIDKPIMSALVAKEMAGMGYIIKESSTYYQIIWSKEDDK